MLLKDMSGLIEEEFLYDAFISYHEKDTEWVAESLIKLLEDEGIRVCWDHRDFEPGKPLIENKLNAICSSATTIAVLSPDYAKDENLWREMNEHCGWDADEIIKEFCLIPVVLRASEVPDIFKPLWKLDWTNKSTRKFFWTKLVQSIKKHRSYNSTYDNEQPTKKIGFYNKKKRQEGDFGSSKPTFSKAVHNDKSENINTLSKENAKLQSRFDNICVNNEKAKKTSTNASLKEPSNNRMELGNDIPKLSESIKIMDNDYSSSAVDGIRTHQIKASKNIDDNLDNEGRYDERKDSMARNKNALANKIVGISERTLVNTDSIGTQKDIFDSSESDSGVTSEASTSLDETDEGEDKSNTKLMENINPRILSFFVPEDDDLTRKDVEELTFKIEDIFAEEAKLVLEKTIRDKACEIDEGSTRSLTEKRQPAKETFSFAQEQMRYLDSLQETEVRIKHKFEKCCDCSRKRIYRRLLERLDKAIFSTVNGIKDTELLASLPISDLSNDESRGSYCSCCDQLFHSQRALDIHVEQCVKKAWMEILRNEICRPKR